MKHNWDTDIKMNDLIIEYNRILLLERNKECRLNNNSILIGSIYNLLNLTTDKKFIKVFNITPTTIKKFNHLININ